ncbi:minor tail protein [Gordonia phage RedWattleHog]|uniref:Minor tail protein n=1 Tax=Gordonia phage Stormageddon TaxID=2656541 RepID=A0A649VR21_9CAUD|nr:minor tail protein [Gordonia phage Stormageddon]QGJ94916.1 minor tail protein [Gordonia phage Stormageddon]QLF83560.1 minor tail protein [Gordonia phage RedWattleHog]
MTGLYFEFHFPLSLRDLIVNLLNFKNFDPKNPVPPTDTSTRQWFSQPRVSTDETVETIRVNYKLPLSVSEVSVEVARVPCRVEFWYKDRSNNWLQMRDRQRVPVGLNVAGSSAASASWYRYTSTVYPIVAKAVEVRIVRTPDPTAANRPYSVGLMNLLVKRNVYERNQGVQYLEEEQDVLGNVISKYIKDWDASKAIDHDASTYWKSGPMPDPSAVVSCYLDVRTPSGMPQAMDQLYIDPVHSGQHLNLYYSNDDTVVSRRISPISLVPDLDNNTDWRVNIGRWDLSNQTMQDAHYEFPSQWGPKLRQPAWFGVEWTPDFDPLNGPSLFPILFKVISPPNSEGWAPEVTYDPGAGTFNLTFRHGGDAPVTYSAPMTNAFRKDEPVRLVAGWAYDPDRFILKVVDRRGAVIAQTSGNTETVPDLITFDSSIQFRRFRGTLTATVLKLQEWTGEIDQFFANPITYVNPDPVLPDVQGVVPPSSLDDAIYAADWTQQEHGIGGIDHTEFASKEWTPIWQNYVAEKGTLNLPQMISAKYLKLEFTNLTEEPYPIYESGIDVSYKVFPISVQQVSEMGPKLYTGSEVGGLLGVANLNGIKSLNWFNPFAVIGAGLSIITPQTEPVRVDTGPGYVTNALPHQLDSSITKSYRAELSSTQVYRRDVIDPYVLAEDQYYTTIKGEGLAKLQPFTNIPWAEIEAANPGVISHKNQLGSIPVRGTDWWIFPGQSLRIPASVMERITSTSTVTERKATLSTRVRFTTTAVHRYETRTLRRDAAIAYFAGLREVMPMISSFIFGVDKEEFDFPFYSPSQWNYTNIRTTPNSVVTYDNTAGPSGHGEMYFTLQTHSNFAKMKANFRDSGMLRGEAMWSSADSDKLSPYAKLLPTNIEGSMWSDAFVQWNDPAAPWGAVRGVVAANLDPDRRYQGRRVLRVSRVAGAGEAGISLLQKTHYIAGALFRLGCVIYKPFDNDNVILLRLVRTSDNAVIYETPVQATAGRWTDFTTELVEVPAGDQEYRINLVSTGDEADELYISDVYSELCHVRYFMQLGSGGFTHEVTDLRYKDTAAVAVTTPVNQATVRTVIMSDEGFAYGCTLTPQYLQ